MGPTCQVLMTANDDAILDAVDAVLAGVAERVDRTRKGKVWDLWVGGRPVHVSISGSPAAVTLAAGCNCPEDYAVLRQLAGALASTLGGVATQPIK